MPGAAYDPTQQVNVHVVSKSPHTFAYRLWVARPGATAWEPLGTGTIDSAATDYGPFPASTRLAYTLLMAGHPATDWKTEVLLSQRGAPLDCSPAAETGRTDEGGVARRDRAVALH